MSVRMITSTGVQAGAFVGGFAFVGGAAVGGTFVGGAAVEDEAVGGRMVGGAAVGGATVGGAGVVTGTGGRVPNSYTMPPLKDLPGQVIDQRPQLSLLL